VLDGMVCTYVIHRKPTHTVRYLHNESNHPPSCKRGSNKKHGLEPASYVQLRVQLGRTGEGREGLGV